MTRALGAVERAFWLLDQATPHNGVMVLHLEGALEEEHLRQAVDWVQRRHPLLQVRVADQSELRFVPDATPVPLRIVPREDERTFERVVDEELGRHFAPHEGPFVRVTLVAVKFSSDVVLVCHHVVCDALSCVTIARDLLKALGELCEGRMPVAPVPLALQPPLEQLLPPSAQGLSRIAALGKFLTHQATVQMFRRPRKLRFDTLPEPTKRQTRMIHRMLTPEETRHLVETSRAEGTTVHSALCAALLLAVNDELDGRTIGCFSAVNLRDRLAVPMVEDIGLYVSQATTFHRLSSERKLWDLAREVRRELSVRIVAGEPFITLPMLGWMVPRAANSALRFARRVDNLPPSAIGMTNLGRQPMATYYGTLRLRNFQIAVGLGVVGPLAAAVTTFEDRLTFNLLYVDPLIERNRAVAFADRATAALRG